ncbi:hypothetical protein Leryth_002685 [Lithospermum erythrorhizon]|nr:hypothetical protein Leryth_002685 [Lithospermum erythrorhizon]
MASQEDEVLFDFSAELKVYKSGKFERGPKKFVPTNEDKETGVSSKDFTISQHASVRIYLPKLKSNEKQKFPVLIYYHGGGFCAGSAFQQEVHCYMNIIASQANVLVVSVEYRLAPDYPMPASYEDSWNALLWIASNSDKNSKIEKEPWLLNHGDFGKVFITGDSAGANIVHIMVMKAGAEKLPGDMKLFGAILCFPYFWSSEIEEKMKTPDANSFYYNLWNLAYPNAPGGIDCVLFSPWAKDAPGLHILGCSKMLVILAEKDILRGAGLQYVEEVKKSGFKGKVEMYEILEVDHCFQLVNLDTEKSKELIKRQVDFIKA